MLVQLPSYLCDSAGCAGWNAVLGIALALGLGFAGVVVLLTVMPNYSGDKSESKRVRLGVFLLVFAGFCLFIGIYAIGLLLLGLLVSFSINLVKVLVNTLVPEEKKSF